MLNRKTNVLVFVGVMVAHMAILYALNQTRRNTETADDEVAGELILLTPLRAATFRSPSRSIVKRSDKVAMTTIDSQIEHESAAFAVTDTDWYGSAADVIAKRANAPKIQEFGAKQKSNSDQERTPEGIFKAPIHKKGDTEKIDGGELITWLDYRCYATNVIAPSIQNANGSSIVCKGNVGKLPADGELFLHLKPSYLQPPQATETEQKILEKR
jgi:hypothetical protein